jgi:N-acetylmuramoyl-L-alanine amidase
MDFRPFYRPVLLLAGLLALAAPRPALAVPLSPLAPRPDWSDLDPYQRTITREEFVRLIDQVYSPDGGFNRYLDIGGDEVTIYSDCAHRQRLYTLHFASSESAAAPRPYHYHTQAVSHDSARPLAGLRIALDPGHIGGDWAQLEGRYFKLGDDPPVEEAQLAMITCKLLAERLEADGADIVWAKHGYEPTTDLRPDDLHREAIAALALRPDTTKHISGEGAIQHMIANEAALLFYRVAEIRARADIVNRLRPDLTICVHYNADDWGDPNHPSLIGNSHLVIFVNGAYEKKELVMDDTKYELTAPSLAVKAPTGMPATPTTASSPAIISAAAPFRVAATKASTAPTPPPLKEASCSILG